MNSKYNNFGWAFTLPGIIIIVSGLNSLGMLSRSDASGDFEIARIVIFYSSILLFVIGLGLLNRRRWAWALILIISWKNTIYYLGYAFWMSRQTYQMLPANASLEQIIGFNVEVVLQSYKLLLWPVIEIWFFSSKYIKTMYEMYDRKQRWTDRCPLVVIGGLFVINDFALITALGAVMAENGILFFWGFLTGSEQAIYALVLMSLVIILSWGCYRLDLRYWWGMIILNCLVCLSNVTAYLRDTEAFALLFPMLQNDSLSFDESQGPAEWVLIWKPLMICGAVLIYLLLVRKYFVSGSQSQEVVAQAL